MTIIKQITKIAWLNEHLLQFNGGVRFIYEVTKRLSKEYSISLEVGDCSKTNLDMFSKFAKVNSLIPNHSSNKLHYWLFYPFWLLVTSSTVRFYKKSYDIFISSSPSSDIWCLFAGVKPIIVCFEPNPWLYNKDYIKGLSLFKKVIVILSWPIADLICTLAYKNAKAVICHSKFVQSEIRRIYKVNSIVIPVGVDIDKFKKVEINPLYNKYKDYNVILHVASYLSPMKGTKYAIEAMNWIINKIPKALLLIITQDTVETQNKLLEQCSDIISKSYGFSKYIEFILNATDNDMINYYSLAKVHLQPSLDENAHYPAIEAGLCECPTVGFNGKFECEDIVNNNTGFTVEKYNSKDLAVATVSILANPSLQDYLGRNAKQFMINKFNWDNYMSKLKEIISES